MSELKYCMVCLNNDVKLFSLKQYSLGDIFTDLTKIPVINWNQHLCFECAYLVQKYQKFKLKCLRADDILSRSVSLTGLTKNALKALREMFKIGSNLTSTKVNIQEVTETDSNYSNTVQIKVETITDENIDIKNNSLYIVPKNEVIPIEVENLSKDKNTEILDPIEIEQVEVAKVKSTSSKHKPNLEECVDSDDENLCKKFKNDKQQKNISMSNIDSSDDELLQSNSSVINMISNNIELYRQNDDKLEFNIDDNDSAHSPGTSKNLNKELLFNGIISDDMPLNSLHKINIDNKKQFLKEENNVYQKNFTKNRTQNKIPRLNNKLNLGKTVKSIKQSVELINNKEKPKRKDIESGTILKGKFGGLKRSAYNESVITNLEKHGHTVDFLTPEQAKEDVLNRANSDNYKKSPYKCNLCYRGFLREVTLANHMVKHSPEKGTFTCMYCHYRYPKQIFLSIHIKTSHTTKFRCSLCPFVCELDRATNHLRFHEGKTFDCQFCDKKFHKHHSLVNHIHLKHQDKYDNLVICEFCGYSFRNKRGLNQHKDSMHFNEKNEYQGPECKQCSVHFSSQQAWERHLDLAHKHESTEATPTAPLDAPLVTGDKPAVVQIRTPRVYRKKSHQTHTCELCGFELKTEYGYKLHLHKYHGQTKPEKVTTKPTVICEICGEKTSKCHLQSHLRKHTGERPFACKYCGKKYRLEGTLQLHENMHTRAKVYKCGTCHKEFLLPTSYSKHIKTHIGLKPHKCLECDRSFVQKSELNTHIRHKHEKKPYPKRSKVPKRGQYSIVTNENR